MLLKDIMNRLITRINFKKQMINILNRLNIVSILQRICLSVSQHIKIWQCFFALIFVWYLSVRFLYNLICLFMNSMLRCINFLKVVLRSLRLTKPTFKSNNFKKLDSSHKPQIKPKFFSFMIICLQDFSRQIISFTNY